MLIASILTATLLPITMASYDPYRPVVDTPATVVDQTWRDTNRNRDVPVRLYIPKNNDRTPLLIFSHGLGGARTNNEMLGKHLSSRDYVTIFVQHPGSDESVWKDVPLRDRMKNMREAANGKNLMLRLDDIAFVVAKAAQLSEDSKSPLYHRIDANNVGMCGHSFGAVTTQGVSGQSYPVLNDSKTLPQIKAAVMYSPSPGKGPNADQAFKTVKIPWMLMTGTEDNSPIGDTSAADRLKVFPALPKGDKYQVVLFGGEHSAFNDRSLPGDRHKPNLNHHKVMLSLTTAFFDAYLRHDKTALDWLKGEGPRKIMEPKDDWKKK